MSVEDIKKINALVNELLKHGIASTREEAVKLAESMLNKELIEKTSSFTIQGQGHDKDKQEKEESSLVALQRVRNSLEMQISELRSKIFNLEEELKKVKQILEKHQISPQQVLVKEKENKENKEDEKKKESHPKVGQYNQEDVSIEKFFYYGNK